MKVILTYGTFDILHFGHIIFLERAKAMGDYLIVGLSSDNFNDVKGKKSYHPYNERKIMLEAIKYVDLVISEDCWEQNRHDLNKFMVNTFTIGDDWVGKFDDLNDICEVVYLSRTNGISTFKIKNDLGIS